MNPTEVARYLAAHPHFFDEHPELLETLLVPHPHGGRAIPLVERQLLGLREKAKMLEAKLAELVQFGEENDAIGEKVHRLAIALLAAPDVAAALQALTSHLREDFEVPHVVVRLWGRRLAQATPEVAPLPAALREAAERLAAPVCGSAAGNEFAALFGEAAGHVRSLALVPLGAARVYGLLALGSDDPQRFHAEMGTLHLRRIGELVGGALAARG